MDNEYIPVNSINLTHLERKYVLECLDSGWISSEGPYVKRFEEGIASLAHRDYGIAVSNGTAALEVAVAALQIGPGDEVIMPAFTIISCPSSVVKAGGIPVLVDSDLATWNMDVKMIESKITARTKAIMVVHIYGLPVEMQIIIELADKYGLYIIEDAAEMHGQTWRGEPCGSFGHLSTFSFYPNKHITTGEGGMIVTNNKILADRCRSLRNLCFKSERRFLHDELGWNYRMTSLQAALGLAQIERLSEFVIQKRRMGNRYNELLNGIPGLIFSPRQSGDERSIYWVYGLMLEECLSFDASVVIKSLEQRGIGTRPFFWPIHEQPVFINRGWYKNERYPAAEKMARLGFYLPSGLGLTDSQQNKVAKSVKEVMHNLVKK